jgi:hypothetical protein
MEYGEVRRGEESPELIDWRMLNDEGIMLSPDDAFALAVRISEGPLGSDLPLVVLSDAMKAGGYDLGRPVDGPILSHVHRATMDDSDREVFVGAQIFALSLRKIILSEDSGLNPDVAKGLCYSSWNMAWLQSESR